MNEGLTTGEPGIRSVDATDRGQSSYPAAARRPTARGWTATDSRLCRLGVPRACGTQRPACRPSPQQAAAGRPLLAAPPPAAAAAAHRPAGPPALAASCAAMTVDERIVKQRLRSLLADVDFETATQRTITQQLEGELGVPLSAHKPLIKVGAGGCRAARAQFTCGSGVRARAAACPLPALHPRSRRAALAPLPSPPAVSPRPAPLPPCLHCSARSTPSCRSSRRRRGAMTTTRILRRRWSRRPRSARGPRGARRRRRRPASWWSPCRPSGSRRCAPLGGASWPTCVSSTRKRASCR